MVLRSATSTSPTSIVIIPYSAKQLVTTAPHSSLSRKDIITPYTLIPAAIDSLRYADVRSSVRQKTQQIFHYFIYTHIYAFASLPSQPRKTVESIAHIGLHPRTSSHRPLRKPRAGRSYTRRHLQTGSENGETERLCPPSSHPAELRTHLHTTGLYRDPGHPNGATHGRV